MDLSKLREILKIVAESDVAEVEIEEDDFKVVVRRNATTMFVQPSMPAYPMHPPAQWPTAPSQPPQYSQPPSQSEGQRAERPRTEVASPQEDAAEAGEGHVIRAPIVGTFYRRPSPDEASFINIGDTIAVGQVLCIIEAMKLMNEIESEVSGKVLKILVEDGQPVEYDQPLFLVEQA